MIKVRKGRKEDLPKILELIKELALYEKALEQVKNSVTQMEVDGFGDNPVFGFIVAEESDTIIGTSIYYYRYSTWKGKRLYLEDLVVTESRRGDGAGKLLFDATLEIGRKTNCTGMMWQVLDWNEPAINFYKKYNTQFEDNWVNCNIDF
ncbi:Ribosomal protein S18 acetylase RimI [Ekhidna lutea]|uniref:Ribosomal protein S18 acetylase RimI n=1 Tax=Ekhidna lutea TaxID=447679 RepID=A0A239KPB8_EKHLU|nr:GNAT family N-acetyltransferase [Ekhidna lutea]SNT19915.1 Ribosomal protein S18 acetylase RimI [Ekhidna lutea]